MKLSKKKIAIAVAVAVAIMLPFMLLGGDLQQGFAIPWGSSYPTSTGCTGIPC